MHISISHCNVLRFSLFVLYLCSCIITTSLLANYKQLHAINIPNPLNLNVLQACILRMQCVYAYVGECMCIVCSIGNVVSVW